MLMQSAAVTTAATDRPPPLPRTISRRRLFKRFAAYAAVPVVGGVYATQIEPFWLDPHEVTIPVPGLPAAFQNYRIAHLSDLHAGRTPWTYLQRVVERVRALKPDAVAVSGDSIHHNVNWAEPTSRLLGSLVSNDVPVVVSFGNHEYGVERGDEDPDTPDLADRFAAALTQQGCTVLINGATAVGRRGQQLWFVGMDDLWFGDFNPTKAFAAVPLGATTIALSHNPDTAEAVDHHRPGLILAGHTHGGQVRLPGFGALQLNTRNTQLDQGLFHLPLGSPLYVSRGVGYIERVRFYCRPELPVFRLLRA
ncbi:MAG TPA: metallophosphoesterase [Tepidisphaeraceae bacterium]|nr:metallophosphoesterase [Tepidisphaeraceae bacterium]